MRNTQLEDAEGEEALGGAIKTQEDMLAAIDAGNSPGGNQGRIWALDPIDGTKGFLRGGQYAVCLALIVDGTVAVGVLGCPNLPIDDSTPLDSNVGSNASDSPADGKGVLFAAVKGHGATSRPLSRGALQPSKGISMRPITTLDDATFCESVEAAHSSHSDQARIASRLGISAPSVRMDSQAKYASIARGAGDVYLRLPVRKDYQEKIWDHAAGAVIVSEAGGVVSDVAGGGLDFGRGRTLSANKGVVAAPSGVHGVVVRVVGEVLGGGGEGKGGEKGEL